MKKVSFFISLKMIDQLKKICLAHGVKCILVATILGSGSLCQAQYIFKNIVIPASIISTNSKKEVINTSQSLIEDKGRYYFKLSKCSKYFAELYDLGIEMEPIILPEIIYPNGEGTFTRKSEILFEYGPGEGLIDYTIFNFTENRAKFALDGDLMVVAPNVSIFGLDNNLIYGDTIQDSFDIGGEDIIVYDKKSDEILYHYVDEEVEKRWVNMAVGIDGDYIYVAPTFAVSEIIFMGDTLRHVEEESGLEFTTMLFKINWKTGDVVWRHYIGSRLALDRVRTIKVIDDGSIMVEIEINGPVVFDENVYDPLYYGNGETELYNIAVMNISSEGEYIDHLHIHAPGERAIRRVQIEESGEVYAYGLIEGGYYIEIENDTFDFSGETDFSGVLFAFDKNLDMQWHKIYTEGDIDEEGFNSVFGVNKSTNDEVIVTTALQTYTEVEGELYVSDNIDLVNEDQSLILKYDENGVLISNPIKFGNRDNIYDFVTLKEDCYLIFIECPAQVGNAIFLGQSLGHAAADYNLILEVKGDLLKVL